MVVLLHVWSRCSLEVRRRAARGRTLHNGEPQWRRAGANGEIVCWSSRGLLVQLLPQWQRWQLQLQMVCVQGWQVRRAMVDWSHRLCHHRTRSRGAGEGQRQRHERGVGHSVLIPTWLGALLFLFDKAGNPVPHVANIPTRQFAIVYLFPFFPGPSKVMLVV